MLNNTYPTERESEIISSQLAKENMDANTIVQKMSFKWKEKRLKH